MISRIFTLKVSQASRRRFGHVRLGFLVLVLIIVAMPSLKTVHATYTWDGSTKVTLPELSNSRPALAYDAALGKVLMAYVAFGSCNCVHFIWSSDMLTWSSDFATGFGSHVAGYVPSLAYDSGNQKIYLAWEDLIFQGCADPPTCALNFWQWSMYVSSSPDGQTWSNPVVVEAGSGTNTFWQSISIAYNSASNLLVAIATDGNANNFIYTSADGGTSWSNNPQQIYYNNQPLLWVFPYITYINAVYFLTGNTSGNYAICILQSTDLSSWNSENCPPGQSAGGGGGYPIAYDPAESRYHITYKGTDSGRSIWDTVAVFATYWNCCYQFPESSYDQTALAYNSNYQSLLLAWTGTDGCFGTCAGHLNVMQYHSVNCCSGGGGSVASGSLITMADGSQVPVQNIRIGDQVIVYNVPSGYHTVATVEQILVTVANSSLTIHTTAGLPFRADANPNMRLWVLTSKGPIQTPVMQIQSGDQIYDYGQQTWVRVTQVTISYGGQHTVYDLITNPNHTSTGQILEYIANGYPDCPPQGCKI